MFFPAALLAWRDHLDGHNEANGERESGSEREPRRRTGRDTQSEREEGDNVQSWQPYFSLSLEASLSLTVFLPILLSPTSFTILLSLPAIPLFDFCTVFCLGQCPSEVVTFGHKFRDGWDGII